jgi:uncharacterized protein (DUF2225 family)
MVTDVIEVKRRLLALMNDQGLVDEYITRFGPTIDIKYIKTIKEEHSKVPPPVEEAQIGEDPIFELQVKCPICGTDKIISYELRAKSQQILQNKFLVPVYLGASGFKTIDYTLLAPTVCSRCIFASPDRKDFGRFDISTHSFVKSQLSQNVIASLQEKTFERKNLIKFTGNFDEYFSRPRSIESATDSYRLSIARAKVEAWFEQPYSFYKLGSYSLRIAKILKDINKDNTDVLKEALGYFEEAFRTSNCPSEDIEMQVIYNITALYLKLGDQKKANSYIGVFNNLHNTRVEDMREKPSLVTTIIDKWADRAKFLWDDRDTEDVFKDE